MKHRWPYFLLAVFTILFFLPELIKKQGFFYGDNLSHQIPTLTLFKRELLSGRLPLWNPYLLGGIPFLADFSHNNFAPTNIFYLLLPVPIALTFLSIFYVFLASIFTYLLAKKHVEKETSAVFSAISFALSGTVIAAVNDINSLQAIAFIPITIFMVAAWTKKANLKNSLLLIVVLTLQLLSSHPQYTYYTWFLVLAYSLTFSQDKTISAIGRLLAIFLAVLGLSAIQLLPFLEFSSLAFRPQSTQFSSQNSLQLIELPRFILANVYGTWKDGTSWGPGSQIESGLANTEGYLGILPLLLAVVAIVRSRNKIIRFWLAVGIISLVISLGSNTPIHKLLCLSLPLYSKFRSPIRILSIYSFSLSILAGLGLSQFTQKTNK